MDLPKIALVRQNFETDYIRDIADTVKREIAMLQLSEKIKPGSKIAITAGSRGIANIVEIIKALVQELRNFGAFPFLVPTMGSHGGATAQGQIMMLEALGITEETVGAPIVSSMDVVQIGTSKEGIPTWVDQHAANADGVVVLNRIKPHTEFEGEIESGLFKMMVIGMGKHRGALTAHRFAVKYGYRTVLPSVGTLILEKLPVIFGLGIVENVYDQTAVIKAILPQQFDAEEKRLLSIAKKLMPRLPFANIDVLVVSEMGKQISGAGMDPNVIGRIYSVAEPEPETPKITRIAVLDLTEETHGNAIGVGLADYTTRRLVNKINYHDTYINCIAGLVPEKGKVPITLETDAEAINNALLTCGPVEPANARLVWVKNTLELEKFFVSESLLPEVKKLSYLEIISELWPVPFDTEGKLQWKT